MTNLQGYFESFFTIQNIVVNKFLKSYVDTGGWKEEAMKGVDASSFLDQVAKYLNLYDKEERR